MKNLYSNWRKDCCRCRASPWRSRGYISKYISTNDKYSSRQRKTKQSFFLPNYLNGVTPLHFGPWLTMGQECPLLGHGTSIQTNGCTCTWRMNSMKRLMLQLPEILLDYQQEWKKMKRMYVKKIYFFRIKNN